MDDVEVVGVKKRGPLLQKPAKPATFAMTEPCQSRALPDPENQPLIVMPVNSFVSQRKERFTVPRVTVVRIRDQRSSGKNFKPLLTHGGVTKCAFICEGIVADE